MKTRLILSLLCFAAVPAFADSKVKGSAEVFLPKAHLLNTTEVKAGDMGQKKACRSEVRDYGQMLATDHAAGDRDVQNLMQTKGVADQLWLDSNETETIQQMTATITRLENMKGCDFDHEFLIAMRDAHVFAIGVFEAAQESATDPDVSALIKNTLPKLHEHLDLAKKLLGAEGGER